MAIVNLTRAAKNKLIQMIQSSGASAALFKIEGGGCNGMKYVLEPDISSSARSGDEIVSLQDDPQQKKPELRICGKSLIYVAGTTIDWNSDFMGQKFVFDNPNESATCGCGSTFTPNI